ncbi:epoxide hydrolase [Fibrisoma montanum]|uniref:Epoxide hydrolase n=1 Tax=Fibrisoma montanum TaxID=2305895 RepID=A0A418M373_9BACT|nr:epoxide hydrolase family protein [Fibrisoma montanum]RIV19989.1 epoxide hydrolase [Fibrisoma montanum]
MAQLNPFTIQVSQDVLDDLQQRLQRTRWADEPQNADWNYGTNPQYLRELVDYWQNGYDWRKQEAALNELPQFKTAIDGVGIHFIHVKGKGENSKPLILSHGWPDSFYRFYKVIPMLTDPASHGGDPAQSFDVVVPSIPGFGFSDPVALTDDQTADLWAKLMTDVLGYQTFVAAGGDLGSGITKALANSFPDRVQAIHLTDVGYPDGSEDWSAMSPAEQEFGQYIQQWWYTEGAYNMIQSTKPQTLGYALNDSPVGLASWIVEKFYGWSDTQGNIENSFTKDELLTNIMIYWVTQTINTSIRTYREGMLAAYSTEGGLKSARYVDVPTGVATFPADAPTPEEWARRKANVRRFTNMPRGGHFAALEQPALWVADVSAFFQEA